MTTETTDHLQLNYTRPSTVVSSVVIAGASTVIVGSMPLFASLFVEYFGFTLSQAGWVLAVESIGIGAGTALAFFLLPHMRGSRLALGAALLAIVANLASPWASGVTTLTLLRFSSGLGAGLLYSTAIEAVSRARQLGRAFGGVVVAQSVIPVINAAALTWIERDVGLRSAIGSMAFWFALCVPLALVLRGSMPQRAAGPTPSRSAHRGIGGERRGLLSLLGLLLFLTSIFAFWSYAEQIGIERGLAAASMGHSITVALAAGAASAVIAMLCGDRLGRVRMAALACVIVLAGVLTAANASSVFLFCFGLASFCAGWSFGVAYFMSMTAFFSYEMTIARFIPGTQIFSGFLGPALVAALIGGGVSLSAAAGTAIVLALAALLICFAVARSPDPVASGPLAVTAANHPEAHS